MIAGLVTNPITVINLVRNDYVSAVSLNLEEPVERGMSSGEHFGPGNRRRRIARMI